MNAAPCLICSLTSEHYPGNGGRYREHNRRTGGEWEIMMNRLHRHWVTAYNSPSRAIVHMMRDSSLPEKSGCRIAAVPDALWDTPAVPNPAESSIESVERSRYISHDRPNVSRCQSSCINIIRRPIIQLHGRGLGVPSRAHRSYIRPKPSSPLNMDIIGCSTLVRLIGHERTIWNPQRYFNSLSLSLYAYVCLFVSLCNDIN